MDSTKYSTVHVLYRYFFYGFEKEREIAFENTVQSLAEFTKKYLKIDLTTCNLFSEKAAIQKG